MLYPRFIKQNIIDALQDTPVNLITGARQTGKTTLVKQLVSEDYPAQYVTLDDLSIRGAIENDPQGFLKSKTTPLIIDEIQLVPDLLPAIKYEVDINRTPGRFLLTGSANILTLPRISESLAGRMEIHTLFPLSQGELSNKNEIFIDWIFSEKLDRNDIESKRENDIWVRIVNGGYPEIIKRTAADRKHAWFQDYITTILQRDVKELSNIESLTQMPRVIQLLANRISSLLNIAELSRSLQIPQTSLKRYISLLEITFLVYFLPAWSGNLGKRIVKTPKLYFTDTGLAAYLMGADFNSQNEKFNISGPLLENFVLSELKKQSAWSQTKPQIFHFRNQTGLEVDFILEDRRRNCVGIEVKAAATVRSDDFKGLRWFQDNVNTEFVRGIVLYNGAEFVPFGNELYAVPVSALWT